MKADSERLAILMAEYGAKKIDAIADRKTQREIAKEVGYKKANIISMFKTAETKIPLNVDFH
jgi:hypothetical protein